jgi:methylenetetrahydrofolate dehydrogenase (NADP+) / methenyltetrahydrofolate cyclohydrolase
MASRMLWLASRMVPSTSKRTACTRAARREGHLKAPGVARPVAQALDGRSLADRIEGRLREEVAQLRAKVGRPPGLAVVLVGDDGPSKVYVRRKAEACRRVGMESFEHFLPASTSEADVVALVQRLNADERVDGILVQLPLPPQVAKRAVLQSIDPRKDVDAFHANNMGHTLIGDEELAPCTPQGVLLLLDEAGIKLPGAEVCIVNHSNLIGKPLAALLINRDATVTVCHKRTRDLKAHTRRADVVVTATGIPGLITADHLRDGAVVIDVGISRVGSKIVGDAAEDVWRKASWVTPVPGGVGPMTIAVLLQNTFRSYKRTVR